MPAVTSEQLRRVAASCPLDVPATLAQIGGSESTYISILQAFVNSLQGKITAMADLADRDAWEDFRIEVHSQKSALYNIGARALAEKARKLEIAAASGGRDYIQAHLPRFLEELKVLRAAMLEIFPQKARRGKPGASDAQREALPGTAAEVTALLDALEHDEAVREMERLLGLSYDEETDARLESIRRHIDNFDYDPAVSALQALAAGEKGG